MTTIVEAPWPMPDILLTTINARYQHTSLGLRCLIANLGPLQPRAALMEFADGSRTEHLVERILSAAPRIVGIGVYIWNVDACTRLVAMLKKVAPNLVVVVGGPEVSHETAEQRICRLADHVVTGPGEIAFAELCRQLLHGPRPLNRIVAGGAPAPEALALPYAHYTDQDIRERTVYVEASRGCPFRCEFCLSSLDRTAEPFDLDLLLDALATLHARGARTFKFVDRTFNLKIATSLRILQFFLDRIEATPEDPVFAHFELVPDHLPERLREVIRRFPAGTLQFEIGIQTWNPDVQKLISRRQDNDKSADNLRWLVAETQAHLHVDLIAGLPGEDLESFGAGFDRLVALGPHEIQVGILKRLRGAPIARHTATHAMCFNPDPPYNALSTDRVPFTDMQRLARFARFWDMFGNSGRFRSTLPLLLGDRPFERFLAFCDWLHATTDATHRITLERQYELLHAWIGQDGRADRTEARQRLVMDYRASGARGRPSFMDRGLTTTRRASDATPVRQRRHLAGEPAERLTKSLQ